MNVLLIKPWGDSFSWYHSHMLGLTYLAGYIRKMGHQVEILDAVFLRLNKNDLLQEITHRTPDIIGVTAMTHEIPRARSIFDAIKTANPNTWTILGGPHATARPSETIEEIPELDFAISGEGEQPFTSLLERIEGGSHDFEGIEGLAFRDSREAIFNGPQTSYVDLKSIPQPAVDLYYRKGWFNNHLNSEYRIFCSRGCPFRCAYCLRVLGNRVRWRSPDAVIEEWIKAVEYYGARDVFLHDEIFLYDNPNTHAILDGVFRAGLHKKARFHAMTHVKLINKEILEKAACVNCFKVCIGVESGNNEILKRVNRSYTMNEAHEAVQEIKKAGLHPFTFFILGHPGETHRTILDSIKAAVKMNPYEIGMGVMVPYPGTEIYELAKKHQGGYCLNNVDWDAYDRYGGRAMEFDNFTHFQLVIYQVIGYLAFFLLNGKIKGIFRYFSPKIRAAIRVILGRSL